MTEQQVIWVLGVLAIVGIGLLDNHHNIMMQKRIEIIKYLQGKG